MHKRIALFFLTLFICNCLACTNLASPSKAKRNTGHEIFKAGERILVLAPHPDDEAIGCAGIIQQALKTGAQVKVLYLTNGDHNQIAFVIYEKRVTIRKGEFIHMGEVRRKEAIEAMRLLGLGERELIFLGYPDNGTLTIFSEYWKKKRPYKSLLTRISSVPYKSNFSYGAPYLAESILADLKKVLLDYRPDKIFVSHPADTNVDHKAFYLFLQVALWDLNKEIPSPKVYPYLIHCVGWPLPRHFHPELTLEPPSKFSDSKISWLKLYLTGVQLEKKYQSILCYRSQTRSSAFYLLSFARKNELFGDYPAITLNKQVSLKEQGESFFGFSDIFAGSDIGTLSGLEAVISERGQVSYAVVDNCVLIRIEKGKNINRRFTAMFYLFGCNRQIPFAEMPKIKIITKYNRFKVFDAGKMIDAEGVFLKLNKNELILKVPLRLLGEPEFILTSLRAFGGYLPIDATAFRKIEIK